MIAVILLGGCTSTNRPLNPANVALENRRPNHTRAATGLEVPALQSTAVTNLQPPPPAGRDETGGGRPAPADRPPAGAPQRDDDGYFVGIAVSGGGSRSANFAAACFFELQRLGILQKADYISSVSGGSLTSAYYCASGAEWNPGEAQRRLTYPYAKDLLVRTFVPWNYLALVLTDYDRSDLLAGIFERQLFTRNGRTLTFADLREDRPRLLINATDLQSGRPFVFCNETFDRINSDLSQYSLGYAVAASSAVPIVLHQVTLRDYSTTFKQYRHLIDGGIVDNLGIQTLLETYDGQVKTAEQHGRPLPYRNGAVIIVIDAKTSFDARLSDQGDTGFFEGVRAGTGLASTLLVNRAAAATLSDVILKYSAPDVTAQTLREQVRQLQEEGVLDLKDRNGRPVRVVHLALERVRTLTDVPFLSFSERLNNIETYFNIGETEAYHLYQAADLLVREKFEQRLRDIASEIDGRPAERR